MLHPNDRIPAQIFTIPCKYGEDYEKARRDGAAMILISYGTKFGEIEAKLGGFFEALRLVGGMYTHTLVIVANGQQDREYAYSDAQAIAYLYSLPVASTD